MVTRLALLAEVVRPSILSDHGMKYFQFGPSV